MIDYQKKQALIVRATKSLVDDLLERNTNNRTVRKSHMAWITKSLAAGEFVLTPQGIGVSKSGKLIDGQHRLLAIREAGYPAVELLLVTGLDDKSMIYIDQNAKRSQADMLKIVLNESISGRMTAVLNMHMSLKEADSGFSQSGGKASLEDMVELMSEHANLLAALIVGAGNKARAGACCALFHYAIKHSEERAIELADQIRTGENLKREMPAYRLREHLLKRTIGNGGAQRIEDYRYAVAACIAHSNDETITSFRAAMSWKGVAPRVGRHLVKADKKGA